MTDVEGRIMVLYGLATVVRETTRRGIAVAILLDDHNLARFLVEAFAPFNHRVKYGFDCYWFNEVLARYRLKLLKVLDRHAPHGYSFSSSTFNNVDKLSKLLSLLLRDLDRWRLELGEGFQYQRTILLSLMRPVHAFIHSVYTVNFQH